MRKCPILCAFALALLIGATAQAAITVQIIPATGPNTAGSPSTADYISNALYAISHGLSSYQGGGTVAPSAYQTIVGNLGANQQIVSPGSFPTWLGQANPGAVFGPAYANEGGNRFFFGVRALGNGTKFTLNQVNITLASTDFFNVYNASTGFTTYSGIFNRIGIDYGADNALGGGDDTIYNSGNLNANPIDEWDYIGLSSALVANNATELQDTLDYFYEVQPFTISANYTLVTTTGSVSGFATIPVPEPASLALVGIGAICLIRRRP